MRALVDGDAVALELSYEPILATEAECTLRRLLSGAKEKLRQLRWLRLSWRSLLDRRQLRLKFAELIAVQRLAYLDDLGKPEPR